jgi:hypothetical protein
VTAFFHNNYSTPGDFARVITADPSAPVPGPIAGTGLRGRTDLGERWPSRLVATAEKNRLSFDAAHVVLRQPVIVPGGGFNALIPAPGSCSLLFECPSFFGRRAKCEVAHTSSNSPL